MSLDFYRRPVDLSDAGAQAGLFDGLELVRPGIVETSAWLPGQPETVPEEHAAMIVAGVGRRL